MFRAILAKIFCFLIQMLYCIKMKFSVKNFFSKLDQICSFLGIWLHLLKKSLMKRFIFYAVIIENVKTINSFFKLVIFFSRLIFRK